MINFIRDHWLCFLVGGLVGYCIHFCPIINGDRGAACCAAACSCCVDGCDCVDCNCVGCVGVIKE